MIVARKRPEDQRGDEDLVADQYARANGGAPWPAYEDWDDGYAQTSPVGVFGPNRFGLHDTIGNVWEWCRDNYGDYTLPVASGDGLREGTSPDRMVRGGDFRRSALASRISFRVDLGPEASDRLGVRPARAIETAGR